MKLKFLQTPVTGEYLFVVLDILGKALRLHVDVLFVVNVLSDELQWG